MAGRHSTFPRGRRRHPRLVRDAPGLIVIVRMTSKIPHLTQRLTNHNPDTTEDPTLIWAAVAVIIAPSPDAILLIRRAERVGDPWSGHMALPGGRRGKDDATLL